MLVLAACVGLALANAMRAPASACVALVAVAAGAATQRRCAAAGLRAGARARRLVVGERAARRPRAERAHAGDRPFRGCHCRRDRAGPQRRRSRCGSRPRCGASTSARSASACCWSCRSAARRRKEPSSSCERPSPRRAARRTASTSAAGSRAAASTSSCTGDDWRIVGRAWRHRRPLGSPPRACCARDRARARGRAARRAGRDRPRRGRGADGRPSRRFQGLGALPPAGRVRSEHHLPGAGRARPGLAARDSAGSPPRWRRSRAIAAYVLAVGWQPSVVRAGVAGGLASLAWLLSRPRDRWHFLALGAVVLLAWTPASLLEPGFQLSFAAVGSIFLVCPPASAWRSRATRSPNWLREALAVSTACGAATAPILWLQFGSVPVYSLPANVLVTLAIGPLLGIALVGSLARAGAADRRARARLARTAGSPPTSPPVRALIGGLAVRSGRLRHRGLPAARDAGRAARPAPAAAVAATAGDHVRGGGDAGAPRVAVPSGRALAAADRAADHVSRRRPGRLDPAPGARGRSARRPGAAGGGCRAPAARPRRPAPRSDRAHPPGARPRRRRRGHPEAARASTEFSIRGLRSPARSSGPRSPRRRIGGVPVVETRAGDGFRLGRLRLRVLWPDSAGTASENPNRIAIVLLASYGEVDALLTADAETDVTARLLSSQDRDPQGRAPRLGRSWAARTNCASCGRPWRSSPAAATTSTAIRRRPRWPRSATAQG